MTTSTRLFWAVRHNGPDNPFTPMLMALKLQGISETAIKEAVYNRSKNVLWYSYEGHLSMDSDCIEQHYVLYRHFEMSRLAFDMDGTFVALSSDDQEDTLEYFNEGYEFADIVKSIVPNISL